MNLNLKKRRLGRNPGEVDGDLPRCVCMVWRRHIIRDHSESVVNTERIHVSVMQLALVWPEYPGPDCDLGINGIKLVFEVISLKLCKKSPSSYKLI